jgi:hypothetical protein
MPLTRHRRADREQFWRDTITAWKVSGQSVRAFCAARGVSEATFFARRRELASPERPSLTTYSLGKIMVFLLTGQTDVDYVQFSTWRDLITRCIRQDPQQRPVIGKAIEEIASMPE